MNIVTNLEEARQNLARKGYTPLEIDIWSAGWLAKGLAPQEDTYRRLQELIDTKTPDDLDNAIWAWYEETAKALGRAM